jgi:hypothetical protein
LSSCIGTVRGLPKFQTLSLKVLICFTALGNLPGNTYIQFNCGFLITFDTQFRNYVYYDSIATALPGVYAYRYKNQNNDSLMIALWSEEITTISTGNANFTERTGTISLPINAGNYKARRFMEDGSSTMSSTTGTSTAVQFNYAAKPIFIQTILPPRPKGSKGA